MPSKKDDPKKKDTPKKKTPKKKTGSDPKKPNYNKWSKKQLIAEINSLMDVLHTKGKLKQIEKIVEVPAEFEPKSFTPVGPFQMDVIMNDGSPVTLRNPNDIMGFLKGQGLVKEVILK
jgi:hypothetical protein